MRPAADEELQSPYIEEYRCALDAEISKYVEEAYPKGVFSVYCTNGKDVEDCGSDFEVVVDELQTVEVRGKLQALAQTQR
ncbi:putative F-actin-capping protein subunit alpha [Helianthus debilis subsp. tardiflorus]